MTTAPPKKSPWGMAGKLPPLGIAYLAAVLERDSFKVDILDNYILETPTEKLKEEIKKLAPELIGITCSSLTYEQCVETAKAAKETLPNCPVIVGGPHPSYMPETMLKHPEIDYVIIGEGEMAMQKLTRALVEKKEPAEAANIPGIAFKQGTETVKNPPDFISNLDKLPFPARHMLPMRMYDRKIPYLNVEPVDTMHVIRGCPYQCAYCETRQLWGDTCRAFSAERIADEVSNVVKNFGTRGIYFVGDNFTINKKITFELCHLLRKYKLDIEWTCDTRADLVSQELLREMKSAGCQTIFFGIESGSPAILQKLNKNLDLHDVEHAFELCRREGIQTVASFMLGIPGETETDMEATFKFSKLLNADWCQFNIYVACPGSSLYDEVIRDGLYDQMDNFLARVKTKDFDFESVQKIQRKFQNSYNKSPRNFMRVAKREGLASALKKSVGLIFRV